MSHAVEGQSTRTTNRGSDSPNREEFARRYNEFATKLWRWMAARCSDSDVDDICQETWLKVSQSLDSFVPGTNFGAWLFRIADNTKNDFHRRKQVVGRNANSLAEDADVRDSKTSQQTEQSELQELIVHCLSKLPEKQRELIQCMYEGNSLPTCAERLNLASSSAYAEFHKAKASFQTGLEGSWP